MVVLDTNTLIYFFKGMGNISEKLLSTPPQDIAIPAIVLYELKVGIKKSSSPRKRQEQLKKLTDLVTILPFGEAEAEAAAIIRTEMEKNGTPIGPYDTLIAATAIAGNHTLITHNTIEFQRVKSLSIDDWYQ